MDADRLFLHRVRQLSELVKSDDEVDLVDIASKLRLLLFDKQALVDAVNNGRIPLVFEIHTFSQGFGPNDDPYWKDVTYQALQDGADPQTSMKPPEMALKLTREQFGGHVVMYSHGQKFTVKDMVKYNANQKGGQHWDPDGKPQYDKLRVWEGLYIGGIVATSRDLKAIGRIVLRGLEPLIAAVSSRAT